MPTADGRRHRSPRLRWRRPADSGALRSIGSGAGDNNDSLVLRVDFGETSLLITGDAQARERPTQQPRELDQLLERYAGTSLLDVDIYEVGHHGSHNATTGDLLIAATPELALLPVGDPGGSTSAPPGTTAIAQASSLELLEQRGEQASGRRSRCRWQRERRRSSRPRSRGRSTAPRGTERWSSIAASDGTFAVTTSR